MKKLIRKIPVSFKVSVLIFLAYLCSVSGQADKKKIILIPDEVNQIFQTSCMSCHGINGGRFPKGRLNFSRWAAYGPAKEAEKASMICSVLRKGAMPPRTARKLHPELIPTKEQVELICSWARSIKPEKVKK